MIYGGITMDHQTQLKNPLDNRQLLQWVEMRATFSPVNESDTRPRFRFFPKLGQDFVLTWPAHHTFQGQPYELAWNAPNRRWVLACQDPSLLILFKLTWGGR